MEGVFNLNLIGLATIVFRTVVVYLVLLVGLRLSGKRELGQMTTFDLVVILIISNAVQNAMVGSDTSLTGGLLAAVTLLGINRLVGLLGLRFPGLERKISGTPTLLVHNGHFIDDHLRREGVTRDRVMQAAREHGIDQFEDVRSAVLEVDGTISVMAKDEQSQRTRRRLRGRKPIG